MHFISQERYNPQSGSYDKYYRIKESFRDAFGRVHSRVLLNVGFIQGLEPTDIRDIGAGLTFIASNKGCNTLFEDCFPDYSPIVKEHIKKYWSMIIEKGSLDVAQKNLAEIAQKAKRSVDVESIKHTDAQDIGAENLCLQALKQLEFDKFLQKEGWSEKEINTTLAHLIIRAVYSPSELKSHRIMQENSAVGELLTGDKDWTPSLKSIYKCAPSLYKIKDKIEKHLCEKTDNLFNLTNRILLFDLTNFYFEGRKEKSQKSQFGRSKERRSDCKLLVLALCVNTEGFIRYSSILEGNTSDPASLPDMIDTLAAKNPTTKTANEKVLVVIDAGISSEENLQLIKDKGYNYLCVSRNRLTARKITSSGKEVVVTDNKGRNIKLKEVKREECGDYYLEINSPTKALKEASMNAKFRERFELELEKAKTALTKKGGTKLYEKVIERVGKAIAKYPSIAKYYVIKYIRDEKQTKNMADISWQITHPEHISAGEGRYFLRTNVHTLDEKTTWDYYNLIREIEATNRQLKTDLNLRPIYHQTDENSDAHIFMGLLAYWIVNTVRYQLKQIGINHYWSEIVRIMSTQKAVTTEAVNRLGEEVKMRICTTPTAAVRQIYRQLNFSSIPFKKIKICSTQ